MFIRVYLWLLCPPLLEPLIFCALCGSLRLRVEYFLLTQVDGQIGAIRL